MLSLDANIYRGFRRDTRQTREGGFASVMIPSAVPAVSRLAFRPFRFEKPRPYFAPRPPTERKAAA